MKSIIIGNGLNIQFGGKEHLNKEIILRTVDFCKSPDFPSHVIVDDPQKILQMLGLIYSELPGILAGDYDEFAISSFEKAGMKSFKKRYGNNPSLTLVDIGFEDYYIIYDMVCRKSNIENPDRYFARETLKRAFLHAIYNKGKVNKVSQGFPHKLNGFLNSYDALFTTNYDSNIEHFTERTVHHLHGSFTARADVYNPTSLRNHMADAPVQSMKIYPEYDYLYSTALTDYSGYSKEFSMTQGAFANDAIEKFVEGYQGNPNLRQEIESYADDENPLVRKLYETVMLKLSNPELRFSNNYPIEEFQTIKDQVAFLGLSPFNDTHIFDCINENNNINHVTYYYSSSEADEVKTLLFNHEVTALSTIELWKELA